MPRKVEGADAAGMAEENVSSRTRSKTGPLQEEKMNKNHNGEKKYNAMENSSNEKGKTKSTKVGKKSSGMKGNASSLEKMQGPVQNLDAESMRARKVQKENCQEDGEGSEQNKKIAVQKSAGTQTSVIRSSPRLVLKTNLKYADKDKLFERFGQTDVKAADVPETLLELIAENDHVNVKWLLDIGFKPFEDLPLNLKNALNHKSFPLVKALITLSYECLEVLLKFGKGKQKRIHMWYAFRIAVLRMIFLYPGLVEDEMMLDELSPFMRGLKLMLRYGVSVNMIGPDTWELDRLAAWIDHHCKLVTILFVAGAQFETDPDDGFIRDHLDLQPSKFLLYIEDKFYPRKDENGFFEPDTLEEISRDFVRKHLIVCNRGSNLFVLVPQLPVPKPMKEMLLYFKTLED